MILLTGAAGFIGSCLLTYLNREFSNTDILICDDFSRVDKVKNYIEKKYKYKIERDELFDWLDRNKVTIDYVIHLGARTDTTEKDWEILNKLNLQFSQNIWNFCCQHSIPLIYASSAATYGAGEYGYSDDHDLVKKLKPLNLYGISKNNFDIWCLDNPSKPPFWAGLKFFNVFGPNEYHKGRMASVVFHAYNQIKKHGKIILFRSHNPNYKDGMQLRDFIYVKDVIKAILFLMRNKPVSGIYNIGTGKANTFIDLAMGVFNALSLKPLIEFVDTPIDIRDKYQYFTQADITKLITSGFEGFDYTFFDAITEYVCEYLSKDKYF